MSIKYMLMEAFSGNHKKKLLQTLESPEPVKNIPEWCYKKNNIQRLGDEENPVFVFKSKKKESTKAVLYVYGGCGLLGPSRRHFVMASKLADSLGASVYLPFYPLSPKNNVRFSLRWLQKVYADILKDWSTKKVVFVGDSYGANMAMSLCYRVARNPSRLVLISPAVGINNESGLEKRKSAESGDRVMSVDADRLVAANWFKNVHLDSSDADPICVDCQEFPPVLLFYGTKEIYYPSMDNLITKIENSEVPLEIVSRKMCHDWVLLQDTGEGKKALKQIKTFVEKDIEPVQPKVVVPEKQEEEGDTSETAEEDTPQTEE